MKIEPQDRRRVKYECLRLLATLKLNPAKMKLISGFVDTYLKLNAEEERLFKADIAEMIPETREVVMEIVTSWMEEGIEQGIQQGMQREIQVVVQRLLSKRIGNISPELQARISQLSFIQLEELAEAVLDFSSVADLVTWLQGVSA
jgi:hypothetical protein